MSNQIILLISFFVMILSVIYCEEGMSEASYNMIKAAEAGDTDKVIHYFTAKGVDKNTRNNYGVSAIIFAANNGHLDLVRGLVDIGHDIEDHSNNFRTPLHWASLWGHYNVVEYLIDSGANISAYDVSGMTPLMLAVFNNHMHITKLLIKKGADPTIQNIHKGTALSIAKIQDNQDMIDLLQPLYKEVIENSPYILAYEILIRESKIFYQVLQEEYMKLINDANIYIDIFQESLANTLKVDKENLTYKGVIEPLTNQIWIYFNYSKEWIITNYIQFQSYCITKYTELIYYLDHLPEDSLYKTFYPTLITSLEIIKEKVSEVTVQSLTITYLFITNKSKEIQIYWNNLPNDSIYKVTLANIIKYIIILFQSIYSLIMKLYQEITNYLNYIIYEWNIIWESIPNDSIYKVTYRMIMIYIQSILGFILQYLIKFYTFMIKNIEVINQYFILYWNELPNDSIYKVTSIELSKRINTASIFTIKHYNNITLLILLSKDYLEQFFLDLCTNNINNNINNNHRHPQECKNNNQCQESEPSTTNLKDEF